MRTKTHSKSMDTWAVKVQKCAQKCTPNRWIPGLWRSRNAHNMHSKSMDTRAVEVQNGRFFGAPKSNIRGGGTEFKEGPWNVLLSNDPQLTSE